MKNYLHRDPEYCSYIRKRFGKIEAILENELSLLQHVAGLLYNAMLNHWPPEYQKRAFQDTNGNECAAEYVDFCSDCLHYRLLPTVLAAYILFYNVI